MAAIESPASTHSETVPCHLLGLPAELLTCVVDNIADVGSLCHLARTCSGLQAFAEASIYQCIYFRSESQYLNICHALNSRPARRKIVRTLEARYQKDRRLDPPDSLPNLPILISSLNNLQRLSVQSPWVIPGYKHEAAFRVALPHILRGVLSPTRLPASLHWIDPTLIGPYPPLKSVTIHWSEPSRRFWDMDATTARVFVDEKLEEVTVSCANVFGQTFLAFAMAVGPGITPLRKLTLIECNINIETLRLVLSLPAALQYLELGENRHYLHIHRYENFEDFGHGLCARDPDGFFAALQQQAHSLERFTYRTITPEEDETAPAIDFTGFASFQQLRHIELDGITANMLNVLTNVETIPPALTSLCVRGDMYESGLVADYMDESLWMIRAAHLSKSLRCLSVVTTRIFSTAMSINQVKAIGGVGNMFEAEGVHFKLFTEKAKHFRAPFLHGAKDRKYQLIQILDSEHDPYPDINKLEYVGDGETEAEVEEDSAENDEGIEGMDES